jgi:hypothetical protein
MRTATLQQRVHTSVRRTGLQNKKMSKSGDQELLILCPRVTKRDGVIEAIYALYYLPQTYKLIINTTGVQDAPTGDMVQALSCQESLMDRVILKSGEAGASDETSPFLFADIVVYGAEPVARDVVTTSIVIFDLASAATNKVGEHNVGVSDNDPESLATAILNLTRRRYAPAK